MTVPFQCLLFEPNNKDLMPYTNVDYQFLIRFRNRIESKVDNSNFNCSPKLLLPLVEEKNKRPVFAGHSQTV